MEIVHSSAQYLFFQDIKSFDGTHVSMSILKSIYCEQGWIILYKRQRHLEPISQWEPGINNFMQRECRHTTIIFKQLYSGGGGQGC